MTLLNHLSQEAICSFSLSQSNIIIRGLIVSRSALENHQSNISSRCFRRAFPITYLHITSICRYESFIDAPPHPIWIHLWITSSQVQWQLSWMFNTCLLSFSAHSFFFSIFYGPHILIFCLYFTCFSAFDFTWVTLPILSDVALGYIYVMTTKWI